jgi:hypothetical protein
MRKLLVVLGLLLAISAGAQSYTDAAPRKDGVAGLDTLVAATKDTSGYINLYPSNRSRGGDPGFFWTFTAIGSNTTHDSITAVLRVNITPNLSSYDPTWAVIDTFNLCDYAPGGSLSDNECVFLVCDTLNYISAPYGSFVIFATGGGAADSTKWSVTFVSDKGAPQ